MLGALSFWGARYEHVVTVAAKLAEVNGERP